MLELSLLIPVRQRRGHLHGILPLLCANQLFVDGRCQIIVVESDNEPLHAQLCAALRTNYIFDSAAGPFHKTRLLNLALRAARGKLIAPYDVDLVPYGSTFERHLLLSSSNSNMLVAGFRMMTPSEELPTDLDFLLERLTVAPENSTSALRKWLIDGERFGVVPHFDRDRLEALGGWDEGFVGWGCEDQDMIERYVASGVSLVVSPDILYLHLAHPPDPAWAEAEHRQANVDRYYSKRSDATSVLR